MADFDDLDGLDDLGDLQEISFDDTNPVLEPLEPVSAQPAPQPAAPQPAAAGMGGLGAVIYDLIAKRNYQQVIQIAESQKSAVEQDPQVKALVENARSQLQKEAGVSSYLEGARQALAAGQTQQAQAYVAKAREIDPHSPALASFLASFAKPAAPQPAAPQPAAPQPAAPQPAAPAQPMAPPQPATPAQDDMLSLDEPLSFDEPLGDLPDLDFSSDPLPVAPAAPQPATPAQAMAPPQPAAAPAAAPAMDFGSSDDFGDLSLDSDSLPEGFEPAGLETPEPLPDPAAMEAGARIPALIAEGQGQFDQGQYQSAIDTWSRIFLIDIDHDEASRLIEEARNKKAELERQAEELFHSALDHIEAERLDDAKATLAQVLELQPSHSTARDYLDQLEAGQVPVVSRVSSDTGEIDLLDDGGLGAFDGAAGMGGNEEGHSLEAAVARDRVVVVKRTDRKLLGLAALVGLLVVGGGGFLALKWDDLFPNTSQSVEPVKQIDPLARATAMFEAGAVENAVLLLEKITPQDPSYEEAQALVVQWKSQLEAAHQEQDTGPSPAMVQRRDLLVKAARDAHSQQHYIRARKYLDRANRILPLEAEDLSLRSETESYLKPLASIIRQFNEGQYQQIIPELWTRHETNPENRDVKLLLVDSYYNLALTDMQRQNPGEAADKFTEILNLEPGDKEVLRLKLFAESYQNKSPDLLYRIFVKYLPSRS